MDPFEGFKAQQKLGWAHFAPLEAVTAIPGANLVRFAGVRGGQVVLDVGCGTGVTTIAAARIGAKVSALDLTPELSSVRASMRKWPEWRWTGAKVTSRSCLTETRLSTWCSASLDTYLRRARPSPSARCSAC